MKKTLSSTLLLCPFVNIYAQEMLFERIYDETLSQASYIIANSNKEAIVIDPKRDVDTYMDYANKHGLKILYVTETHIHADYLSGARELAQATNAQLILSAEGGENWKYEFPHLPLVNNQTIYLGEIHLQVMHTPGHTPESITFLVKNTNKPNDPIKAITGDFVFVGDVGRPDLLEKAVGEKGSQYTGAYQLFESLKSFSALPDHTEIWPGHGAGSFCGKSLSNIPQSTLAQEKKSNKAFQLLHSKEEFTTYILDGQPEPPKYFNTMKQWNKQIRPLLIQIPKINLLSKDEVKNALAHNVLILDTRKINEVSKGFISGSLHIPNNKSFPTFVGSLIDYDQQLILIVNENELEDITRKLMRIGMTNIYGYITDISDFSNQKKVNNIAIDEVKKKLNDPTIQIVDVRTTSEFESGHIQGAINISLNSLAENSSRINKETPVIIHCQSGVRAAMAYSILEKLGFTNILNYSGGINEWEAHHNELVK